MTKQTTAATTNPEIPTIEYDKVQRFRIKLYRCKLITDDDYDYDYVKQARTPDRKSNHITNFFLSLK